MEPSVKTAHEWGIREDTLARAFLMMYRNNWETRHADTHEVNCHPQVMAAA